MSNTATETKDFAVQNHGSIFVVEAITDECFAWMNENVGDEETQSWGKRGIVVEPRYVADLIQGLRDNGFIGY